MFSALSTQWVMAESVVVGLRYGSIPVVLEMVGVKKDGRQNVLQTIRIMEQEALQVINRKNG